MQGFEPFVFWNHELSTKPSETPPYLGKFRREQHDLRLHRLLRLLGEHQQLASALFARVITAPWIGRTSEHGCCIPVSIHWHCQ
jgi:hypothetical protein